MRTTTRSKAHNGTRALLRGGPLNQPEVEFDPLFRADRAACEIGVGGIKQVMPFAGDNHAGQSENG